MSVKIRMIENERLNSIAREIDRNNKKDGKLKGEEIELFKQAAIDSGFNEYGISIVLNRADNSFASMGKTFSDWWTDKNKVSTDEKDDGKISTSEKINAYTVGFAGGIIKNIIKNPVESLAVVGGTAIVGALATKALALTALAPVAGPVVAGALALVGLGFGITAIVKSAKAAKQAKTDGEAKAAWENMGMGTEIALLSALSGFKLFKNVKTKVNAQKSERVVEEQVRIDEPNNATKIETTSTNGINETCKIKKTDIVKNDRVSDIQEIPPEYRDAFLELKPDDRISMMKFLQERQKFDSGSLLDVPPEYRTSMSDVPPRFRTLIIKILNENPKYRNLLEIVPEHKVSSSKIVHKNGLVDILDFPPEYRGLFKTLKPEDRISMLKFIENQQKLETGSVLDMPPEFRGWMSDMPPRYRAMAIKFFEENPAYEVLFHN